ncbi:unnamed protein product [Paramecium pentaurelia]|uniref:Uncharacterized protein n=1 Tax=Paramecium pentaurelia TaxID=43138 RepID=A0A8S1Y1Z9_9CILI|nr:unnamed protein product [Paramecium pentaurelia]
MDPGVVKFYQKVLSDPSVSHYFKNTNMKEIDRNVIEVPYYDETTRADIVGVK